MKYLLSAIIGAIVSSLWWAQAMFRNCDDKGTLLAFAIITSIACLIGIVVMTISENN